MIKNIYGLIIIPLKTNKFNLMKKHFNILLIILTALAFAVSSCVPDEDDDETGPYVDPRSKFTGSWNCVENSKQFGQQTYNVNITLNPNNSTEILIANIYHFGFDEKAYAITSNNSATIPLQPICNNTNNIKGSGMLSGNSQINWTYYVDDGADIDTCTAVYTKL